jgi:hypothetical protein
MHEEEKMYSCGSEGLLDLATEDSKEELLFL